jgi:hypothetical protein
MMGFHVELSTGIMLAIITNPFPLLQAKLLRHRYKDKSVNSVRRNNSCLLNREGWGGHTLRFSLSNLTKWLMKTYKITIVAYFNELILQDIY